MGKKHARYADLAEHAPAMTRAELAAHYGVSFYSINGALNRRGIQCRTLTKEERYKVAVKAQALSAKARKANNYIHRSAKPRFQITETRSMGAADMAADHLRRLGAIWRCTPLGAADPKGTHFRWGSNTKTADEIIALAVRKGWNPNAWKQVKAA